MGKLILVALVVGIAYAWHKGMLDPYLGQAEAPPAKGAQRYDHAKRYGSADVPLHEQCAQARSRLRELESWAEKNVKDPAIEQTRQFLEDRCRGL